METQLLDHSYQPMKRLLVNYHPDGSQTATIWVLQTLALKEYSAGISLGGTAEADDYQPTVTFGHHPMPMPMPQFGVGGVYPQPPFNSPSAATARNPYFWQPQAAAGQFNQGQAHNFAYHGAPQPAAANQFFHPQAAPFTTMPQPMAVPQPMAGGPVFGSPNTFPNQQPPVFYSPPAAAAASTSAPTPVTSAKRPTNLKRPPDKVSDESMRKKQITEIKKARAFMETAGPTYQAMVATFMEAIKAQKLDKARVMANQIADHLRLGIHAGTILGMNDFVATWGKELNELLRASAN